MVDIELSYKTDVHRRLCIKKDLIELSHWIDVLSVISSELEQLKLIEKQLLKNSRIETNILGLRRKNTLVMGMLCKYEQELKIEYQYGKTEYTLARVKLHENKRDIHVSLIQEFNQLKKTIYSHLIKYQLK